MNTPFNASGPSFGSTLSALFWLLLVPPAVLWGLREIPVISEDGAQMLWLAYAGFLLMVFAYWRSERKRQAAQAVAESDTELGGPETQSA